jgi:hypothetical protein
VDNSTSAPPPEDPEGDEPDGDDLEGHREIVVMLTPPSEVARLRCRVDSEFGGRLQLLDVPGDNRSLALFAETDEDWADVRSVSITRVLPQSFIWKLVVFTFHISPATFIALISVISAGFGAFLYRVYLSYDPYSEFFQVSPSMV